MTDYNPFLLKGKRVLITGASSGIGKATAEECAKCGARLVLTARNEERLKTTLDSLEGDGHQIVIADLTVQEDIVSLVSQLEPLDGLVFCAGINDKSIIKFLNKEHVDRMLATNFTSPVFLSHYLTKKKKLNKQASIVFISSISAFFPSVSNAMYASSKAALSQFARVLALELLPQRIRVNCIEPAFVETGMLNKYEISERMDEIRAEAPFGRFLEPKEVAQAAIYLLSDTTKLVTGTSLVMDGGFLLK